MLLKTLHRKNGIDLGNFAPKDVDVRDIAQALARLCRYGGHTTRFYSVAEHSFRVMSLVSERYKFEALMHDASEAYLVDIPAPLKELLPKYSKIEQIVDRSIRNKFGLPTYVSPPVAKADLYIRRFELYELGLAEIPENYDREVPSTFNFLHAHMYTYFMGLFTEFYRLHHGD